MKHSPNTQMLQGVYREICTQFDMSGSILEIGCGPSEYTVLNMDILKDAKFKVGINLQHYTHYEHFHVIECNSNDMHDLFDDNTFDVIFSICVLEHDKYFWKSLEEIRRVIKPGGLFLLAVPALANNMNMCKYVIDEHKEQIKNMDILNSTLTYCVHNAPGDYWRFTEQAYKEILLEGFIDIEYSLFLMPPIIVGYGTRVCCQ